MCTHIVITHCHRYSKLWVYKIWVLKLVGMHKLMYLRLWVFKVCGYLKTGYANLEYLQIEDIWELKNVVGTNKICVQSQYVGTQKCW